MIPYVKSFCEFNRATGGNGRLRYRENAETLFLGIVGIRIVIYQCGYLFESPLFGPTVISSARNRVSTSVVLRRSMCEPRTCSSQPGRSADRARAGRKTIPFSYTVFEWKREAVIRFVKLRCEFNRRPGDDQRRNLENAKAPVLRNRKIYSGA